MTRRRWGIVALAVALVSVGVFLWRHRHPVEALPPAVAIAVGHERADRARVDSQITAATIEAEAAQRRQDEATARAKAAERRARLASDRADSLAHEAEQAASARDSALYWHLAYAARTTERDTLLVTIAEQDIALDAAEARAAALTRADSIAKRAQLRADSVLDAVVASVVVCTVPGTFGRVRCPSRTTALAVGILGGLATEEVVRAVKDGRIRISLPFLRSDRR